MGEFRECNSKAWQYVKDNLSEANNKYWLNVRDNAMIYGENIKAYNDYLNFIAYLVKTMSIPSNAISSAVVLRLLMDKGVFSYNGILKYSSHIDDDISGFLGINVVLGKACCRHITSFQSDVLGKNFLISEPFHCYMTEDNLLDAHGLLPNHVINLINYNGIYYGYDATNDKLFEFVSENKMQQVFTDKPSFLFYAPHSDMITNGMSREENEDKIKALFKKSEGKKIISKDEYDEIRYFAKSITNNERLLNDYKESSKKYIKKITKGIK